MIVPLQFGVVGDAVFDEGRAHALRVQDPEKPDESNDGWIEDQSHDRVGDLTEGRIAFGARMQAVHLARNDVKQERRRGGGSWRYEKARHLR